MKRGGLALAGSGPHSCPLRPTCPGAGQMTAGRWANVPAGGGCCSRWRGGRATVALTACGVYSWKQRHLSAVAFTRACLDGILLLALLS